MLSRRIALGCTVIFLIVMVWDVVVERSRLGGARICVQDAETARSLGMAGPGVFQFDRSTGRPVRVPPSIALAMVAEGTIKPGYSDQSACGLKALGQTGIGLVAVASLLGTILSLLAGVFLKGRRHRTTR